MDKKQPEALRLADRLDCVGRFKAVAAELRRQHEVIDWLVQSNKELAEVVFTLCLTYRHPKPMATIDRSNAALTKAGVTP